MSAETTTTRTLYVHVVLKPWPNGVASGRKLKTWVYLRRTPFGQALHALALICTQFGRDQICTKVKASFSSFGRPTQVNAS